MTNYRCLLTAMITAIFLALPAAPAVLAQGPPDQEQQPPAQQEQQPAQDPPARVARLSYSDGSVSFQPGGESDWVQAVAIVR